MDLRQFWERYGVTLAVVVGFALMVAVLPGNAEDRRVDVGSGPGGSFDLGDGAAPDGSFAADGTPAAADGLSGDLGVDTAGGGVAGVDGGGGTGGGATGGDGGPAPGEPDPGAGAGGEGGPVRFGQGPSCRDDGRQKGISRYMPPCVEWTGGSNGGATFRGVTDDKVVVVAWHGQIDPATRAILQGADLADDPRKVREIYDALRVYSNQHYETYGREVVFVDYEASGASESDEAMKRDAINIAQMNPFAVIEGNPAAPMPVTLHRDLAQRQILCMCSTSMSSEYYNELPPMLWSSLPTVNEYAQHAAEYAGKRLKGRPARWAGDDLNPTQRFRDRERVFGLIYLNGARGRVEPEGERARQIMEREFARHGIAFKTQIGYIYDPGRNQQDVTALIARLKNDGVTTIVTVWDPLYPILITTEATNQLYFPEWMIVGTGLSDTTSAGRLYDQNQWRHAFGISPLWVTWQTVARSTGAREYHHGRPGRPPGDEGVLVNIYRARIQTLFRGVHMAGPNLTNESFVRGLLSYPPTGGTPASPLVFTTRQYPTEIKDFVEVFYAANASGPDERGKQGRGMIMKVDGGKRYKLGEWPTSAPRAFDMNGAIAVSDNPPGGGDPPHEQDGHRHEGRCLSCR
jgi:hypothetical protein